VGTLVAGIAHEVNNPLAFIHANLMQIQRFGEIVEAHREGPAAKLAGEHADLAPIAAETLDGIQRIERIVADMRRLSSSREETLVRIDLNEVARNAIRLANLHRDASVAIEVSFWGEPLCVEGSAQRLVQAVLNVLVNSRQALGRRQDGQIALCVRTDADLAVIEVRDNGPGIPRELHERIFDPFLRRRIPTRGPAWGSPSRSRSPAITAACSTCARARARARSSRCGCPRRAPAWPCASPPRPEARLLGRPENPA